MTTKLGRRVLKELYKASQEPARRYEFVRDGDRVFAWLDNLPPLDGSVRIKGE